MIFLNMPLTIVYFCIFLLIFSIAGLIVYTEEISLSSKWEIIISLSFIFIVSLALCLYIQIIFKWFVFMSMDWNRIINDLSARSTTLRYLGVLLFGMSGWSYLIQWYFSIINYQFCYKNIAKTTTNFMLVSSWFLICGFGEQVSNIIFGVFGFSLYLSTIGRYYHISEEKEKGKIQMSRRKTIALGSILIVSFVFFFMFKWQSMCL
jgi:hypothetical protein